MRPLARLLFCLACLLLPPAAGAGAWMRDSGHGFLSFGLDVDDVGTGQTMFLEYGLGPRLTLGLDGWRSASGDWALLATAQFPLGRPEGQIRTAVSLGAGAGLSGGRTSGRLRAGLHAGKGTATGWLSVDASATLRTDTGQVDTKVSGTWGRTLSKRCSSVVEGRVEGTGRTTLAPSVVCSVTPSVRLRLGGASDIAGGRATTFGLQAWVDF